MAMQEFICKYVRGELYRIDHFVHNNGRNVSVTFVKWWYVGACCLLCQAMWQKKIS